MNPTSLSFAVLNLIMLVIVYYWLKRYYGKTDAALLVTFSIVFGVAGESWGLATGEYHFGELFDYPYAGTTVPLAIAFAWAWVLSISMILADHITKGTVNRYFVMVIIAVGIDFIIFEPLAMHYGFWVWENPAVDGFVAPAINYIGWFVVALLTAIFWTAFQSERAKVDGEDYSFIKLRWRGD